MNQKQQLTISKYEENLLAQAIDSKVSFNQIDTPGWTSMVNTLKQSATHKSRPINQILINDDYFTGKDISNIEYSRNQEYKIRRSDVNIYMQNEKLNPTYININGSRETQASKESKPMKLSQRIQMRLKNHMFQSENSSSFQFTQAQLNSVKTKSKIAQMSKQSSAANLKNNTKKKRFKEITVHQHLYQFSKRLQNKRAIESVLDQRFQNKYITTFQPSINSNSNKIFQQKTHKACNLQKENSVQNAQNSKEQKGQKVEVQQNNQNHQEQLIKKLFDFLSKSEEKITQKSINSVIQQIPLSCVRYLQKFIFKSLSGKTFSFPDFKASLDDKKLVCNKKSLLTAFQRWKQGSIPKQNSIAQKWQSK